MIEKPEEPAMRFCGCVALLVALGICIPISAQLPPIPKNLKPQDAPPNSGLPIEVHFSDGSVMKLSLLDPALEITTRYGKLVVPIADMQKIQVGLRYPEGTQKKIEAAIEQLGDKDYHKREAAGFELLRLRELSYPFVKQATQHAIPEVSSRAEKIIEELERRLPEEFLNLKASDVVETVEFSITGQLKIAALKAYSPYLGQVEVKLTDARLIVFPSANAGVADEVSSPGKVRRNRQ
jgi:hypothetical protein